MTEWISVKYKLPEDDRWVLIGSASEKRVDIGIYMNGKFVQPDLRYFELKETTHWQPLPSPPKD